MSPTQRQPRPEREAGSRGSLRAPIARHWQDQREQVLRGEALALLLCAIAPTTALLHARPARVDLASALQSALAKNPESQLRVLAEADVGLATSPSIGRLAQRMRPARLSVGLETQSASPSAAVGDLLQDVCDVPDCFGFDESCVLSPGPQHVSGRCSFYSNAPEACCSSDPCTEQLAATVPVPLVCAPDQCNAVLCLNAALTTFSAISGDCIDYTPAQLDNVTYNLACASDLLNYLNAAPCLAEESKAFLASIYSPLIDFQTTDPIACPAPTADCQFFLTAIYCPSCAADAVWTTAEPKLERICNSLVDAAWAACSEQVVDCFCTAGSCIPIVLSQTYGTLQNLKDSIASEYELADDFCFPSASQSAFLETQRPSLSTPPAPVVCEGVQRPVVPPPTFCNNTVYANPVWASWTDSAAVLPDPLPAPACTVDGSAVATDVQSLWTPNGNAGFFARVSPGGFAVLTSPSYVVLPEMTGDVVVSLLHEGEVFSVENVTADALGKSGLAVLVSINGGPWTPVPMDAYLTGGPQRTLGCSNNALFRAFGAIPVFELVWPSVQPRTMLALSGLQPGYSFSFAFVLASGSEDAVWMISDLKILGCGYNFSPVTSLVSVDTITQAAGGLVSLDDDSTIYLATFDAGDIVAQNDVAVFLMAFDGSGYTLEGSYVASTAKFFRVDPSGAQSVSLVVTVDDGAAHDASLFYDILILTSQGWMSAAKTCGQAATSVGTVTSAPVCNVAVSPADYDLIFVYVALTPATSTRVFGDPHFVGLKGQRFLLTGTPGKVYNLISTPNLLVNALFGEQPTDKETQTVIKELGFVVANDSIFADADARLRVNDVTAGNLTAVGHTGTASLSRDVLKRGQGVVLRSPEFLIRIVPRGYEIDIKDIRLMTPGSDSMHGLIGQTWNSQKWPASSVREELKDEEALFAQGLLEGDSVEDYRVTDGLFGHSFRFSTFDATTNSASHKVPSVSASIVRKRH
eukprot:TRINITY_DN461_c0_g2_i2.p1 TRINITY_DN461_c0_g2~~TRINITY_DN461_c0_g2_i2.p1  ORF type:complete len:977 (-),score=205.82 TRINITY_DN461_c0_g2_i2:51-2981(-)